MGHFPVFTQTLHLAARARPEAGLGAYRAFAVVVLCKNSAQCKMRKCGRLEQEMNRPCIIADRPVRRSAESAGRTALVAPSLGAQGLPRTDRVDDLARAVSI